MGKNKQKARNLKEIKETSADAKQTRNELRNFEFQDAFKDISATTAQAGTLGEAATYDASQIQGGTLGAAQQASAQGYQSQGYTAAQAQAAQADKTDLGEGTGRTNQFANLQVGTAGAQLEAAETDAALAAAQQSGAITGGGGATALAQAAAKSKQGISAGIQQQELQNAQARAQGATDVQREDLSQRNLSRQANIQQDQYNTGLQQQTALSNQQATNQASQFGAAAANQASQFGAAAANQASQFNASSANQFSQAQFSADNQIAAQNAAAQNQSYQFGASQINAFQQNQFAADNQASQANADRLNQFEIARAEGAASHQTQQYNQIASLYNVDQAAKQAASAQEQKRRTDKGAAVAGVIGSVVEAAGSVAGAAVGGSDPRMKENINLVGQSPSGLNIYQWNYIGDEGRYEGVMSTEVPEEAVVKNFIGEFDGVDYSKIDVKFKQV